MSNISQSTTSGPSGRVRIDKAFAVVNQMVVDGVIENYAVGGATGAFFYIEPDTTYDVDIFVEIQTVEPNALDVLAPIYEYLTEKKYKPEMEAVLIEGVAVQFLPVFNPLNEEAVADAAEFDYEGVTVKVMRAEHLVAIMLQTGRSKDLVRIARFVESDVLDDKALMDILARHKLKQRWNALGAIQRRLSK
jgi:predicted nucleotidyltransferase